MKIVEYGSGEFRVTDEKVVEEGKGRGKSNIRYYLLDDGRWVRAMSCNRLDRIRTALKYISENNITWYSGGAMNALKRGLRPVASAEGATEYHHIAYDGDKIKTVWFA